MPAKRTVLTRSDPIEARAPVVIERLSAAYPDATVALRFSNPLECLIATILSAQCTDEKVNEVTETLFVKYRSAADYLAVPEDELKADIHPTGFFNQKAASIRAACTADRRGLRRPGARHDGGPAHAAWRRAQDREHRARERVRRRSRGSPSTPTSVGVSNRLGFSEESDGDKIERDLMRLIPGSAGSRSRTC